MWNLKNRSFIWKGDFELATMLWHSNWAYQTISFDNKDGNDMKNISIQHVSLYDFGKTFKKKAYDFIYELSTQP
jgi:hypothetical protein